MSDGTDAPRLGERFAEALAYAARLHMRQTRKAKDTPYIAHLLGVASLAIDSGADEDEAIAAVLHDAVEDQGGEPTRLEIERRFGERVASLVVALSDSLVDTSDGSKKEPWQVRKDRYIEHLKTADRSVRLLAACDKLHNLRELVEEVDTAGHQLLAYSALQTAMVAQHSKCAQDMERRGIDMIYLAEKLKELAVVRELGARDVAIYQEGFALGSSSTS